MPGDVIERDDLALLRHYDGAGALAQQRVRESHYGWPGNFGGAGEERFALPGLDAIPAPGDQVPRASDDHQVARCVVAAQIPGSKPSVCCPHFAGRGLVAEVAVGAAGSSSPDLA